MWLLFGVLSIVSAVISIVLSLKRDCRLIWATICSLSFTALAALAEYALVNTWVKKEDWSALMDVVPTMLGYLTGYVFILVSLNVVAVFVYIKQQSK